MTTTPSHRLYWIAAVIFSALIACARSPGGVGTPPYLIALAVAGIAYLLAVREFFCKQRFSRKVVLICLALAALWRIPFLLMPIGPDDDIHRYLWDGRVQRLGYNPYNLIPGDPALAGLHTADTRGLNNPEVPTPYPAGAQLFFRAVTTIHESIFAFKMAFVVCDLAIVLLLLDVLRRSGQGEHWVLAYAWHPLIALNVVGSGHVDILGALLLLVSAVAIGRSWRMIAAVAFGLAIAVKFLPIVLTPLYWRRVRIRDAFAAAVVFAALYVPFLNGWHAPVGSLGTFLQRFRFNAPVFAMLERMASPQTVAGLAVVVGLITAGWLRSEPPACEADKWAWPMAASLACSPVVYPWYLLWLLPFLRSRSILPLMVWTVSILPTYLVWHLRTLGQQWRVPGWVLLLEYGSVAVAAGIVIFHRTTQRLAHQGPCKSR